MGHVALEAVTAAYLLGALVALRVGSLFTVSFASLHALHWADILAGILILVVSLVVCSCAMPALLGCFVADSLLAVVVGVSTIAVAKAESRQAVILLGGLAVLIFGLGGRGRGIGATGVRSALRGAGVAVSAVVEATLISVALLGGGRIRETRALAACAAALIARVDATTIGSLGAALVASRGDGNTRVATSLPHLAATLLCEGIDTSRAVAELAALWCHSSRGDVLTISHWWTAVGEENTSGAGRHGGAGIHMGADLLGIDGISVLLGAIGAIVLVGLSDLGRDGSMNASLVAGEPLFAATLGLKGIDTSRAVAEDTIDRGGSTLVHVGTLGWGTLLAGTREEDTGHARRASLPFLDLAAHLLLQGMLVVLFVSLHVIDVALKASIAVILLGARVAGLIEAILASIIASIHAAGWADIMADILVAMVLLVARASGGAGADA